MKKLYKLSEKIASGKKLNPQKVFLALHTILYFFVMLLLSLPFVLTHNLSITTMSMIVGYPTIFLGFYAGALFVYRK